MAPAFQQASADAAVNDGRNLSKNCTCDYRNLQTGRVVACFCVDAERRKSLGGAQFDLDLSSPSVVVMYYSGGYPRIYWVAQLRTDLRGNVRQFIYILDCKSAPTGQFRHFSEQRGTVELLRVRLRYSNWSNIPIGHSWVSRGSRPAECHTAAISESVPTPRSFCRRDSIDRHFIG